jgi:hypothetical protein
MPATTTDVTTWTTWATGDGDGTYPAARADLHPDGRWWVILLPERPDVAAALLPNPSTGNAVALPPHTDAQGARIACARLAAAVVHTREVVTGAQQHLQRSIGEVTRLVGQQDLLETAQQELLRSTGEADRG